MTAQQIYDFLYSKVPELKVIEYKTLEETIKEQYKNLPSITHHRWEDKEGIKYSSWRLVTNGITINTGDAGMKLIQEEFRKQGMKYGK